MCGACWAFATTATGESDYYYKTNVILDLSEEYIMQCTGGDNDCSGGYFEDAYLFLETKGRFKVIQEQCPQRLDFLTEEAFQEINQTLRKYVILTI